MICHVLELFGKQIGINVLIFILCIIKHFSLKNRNLPTVIIIHLLSIFMQELV